MITSERHHGTRNLRDQLVIVFQDVTDVATNLTSDIHRFGHRANPPIPYRTKKVDLQIDAGKTLAIFQTCRMLAPTIEAIAEEHSSAVSVVKVNVDENPTTAGVYGIKGIPTLMLFSDGKEIERTVGVASKDTIVRTIEKHAKLENTERQAA